MKDKAVIDFFFQNKDFIRACEVSLGNSTKKPRAKVRAEALASRLDKADLENLALISGNKAFLDLCDLLRVCNKTLDENKTYDNFPLDLVEIINYLNLILKKQLK